MSELVLCEVCHRHVKSTETACPFCSRSLPGKVALGVLAVGIAFSVMACYGPPPREFDDGHTPRGSGTQQGGGHRDAAPPGSPAGDAGPR
jgi:hypothetical protein